MLKKIIKFIKLKLCGFHVDRYSKKNEIELECKVAVYTALFGEYDQIFEPCVNEKNIDYYIITDMNIPKSSKWTKINIDKEQYLETKNMNNSEKNRYFKILGYKIFSKYEYSIYLDSNIEIKGALNDLLKYANNDIGFATYNHSERSCLYQEIKACKILKKAPLTSLKKQKKRYKRAGMVKNYGLSDCGILVRQSGNIKCDRLMDAWWKEYYDSESKRDQIALPYVMWLMDIKFEEIGCLGENMQKDHKCIRHEHAV